MSIKNEKTSKPGKKSGGNGINIRWLLLSFDTVVFAVCVAVLYLLGERGPFPYVSVAIAYGCVIIFRFIFNIYRQVWRYGGVPSYIKLMTSDAFACAAAIVLNLIIPGPKDSPAFVLSLVGVDLLVALGARVIYSYCYKNSGSDNFVGRVSRFLLRIFGIREECRDGQPDETVNVAIVGAGKDGTALAEALVSGENTRYKPKLFIDIKSEKIGRRIFDIEIISEDQVTRDKLHDLGVTEIIFAIPDMPGDQRKLLYEKYKDLGCKLKVYDKNAIIANGNPNRIHLREFDIEDLLFRNSHKMIDEHTAAYYKDKVILVTGGGGSIGSELCRQIARMGPRTLVILDVYENGAYDIQQELRIKYGASLDVRVEIVSVCNLEGLEKVFRAYQPQIVLHAAAHKHVPLMEKNCVEAVENNVFGTYNVVSLTEKYEVERFIMISTDKAVNPTNVMGATKRVCEMITQSFSQHGKGTVYSATRFGNVLGSAGSVIPLFKRQISRGGPVTVTDKRINRYFMTIPEASQLVLQSGAMAKNGELFVLDMGQPVRIIDLAENMIKLSGYVPYKDIDIIETGLRPGEKLYEELLVKTEELDKTENSLIFIERDAPLSSGELEEKLAVLKEAVRSGSDEQARHALMETVPTYHTPAEVNGKYYEKPQITLEEKSV